MGALKWTQSHQRFAVTVGSIHCVVSLKPQQILKMPQISSLQDRTIRDRALDPSRSFIVQAPAGSGKTELLIRRFLMLLAHAQDPEEIVAITFTRKAAYEMRERVLQALYAETEDTLADTAHQQLIDLASAARARNDQKGWELEKHPSRLRIRTIDSVCRMLVERMPWLSGFGASPAVVEDASTMYLEAAQATLSLLGDADQAWSGAVEALLTHFDNNFAKVAQLLVAMLARLISGCVTLLLMAPANNSARNWKTLGPI